MPRELWAKVAVEIIRDPKLVPRAPWERWLWLGLICLAKEFGKDGVIAYDARALANTLDLRVKPAAVASALAAFERSGMVRLLPDNGIEIVHFVKRQEGNGAAEGDAAWREQRAIRERTNFVYFIQAERTGLIKIGTSKNPWARLNALQFRANGETLKLIGMLPASGYDAETKLHERFKAARKAGEWFDPVPELVALATSTVAATGAKLPFQVVRANGSDGGYGSAGLQLEEEEEKEEEEEGEEEDRRSADAPHAPPPPPPSPPAFTTDALVEFIAQAWPELPNSRGAVVAWRSLWPNLDLLSEAKFARAKELVTERKEKPGAYLQHWYQNAAADAAERKATPKAATAGPIAAPLTPAATSRMLDEKDRGFREEKARKGDVASRQWLRQRWPEAYPEADDERWKGTA